MIELIENAERITGIFEEWPSFHDAEILRVILDRSGPDGPTLEVQIHVFKMTNQVRPSGPYVQKHPTLVTFRFTGVVLERLEGFNQQNVLSFLDISSLDPDRHDGRRLAVQMPALYGLEAAFECIGCEVIDARPYDVSTNRV